MRSRPFPFARLFVALAVMVALVPGTTPPTVVQARPGVLDSDPTILSQNPVQPAADPHAGWEEVGAGSATGGGISSDDGLSTAPSLAVDPDGSPCIAWGDQSNGSREVYVRCWSSSSEQWEEVGTGSASGGGISNTGGAVLPSLAFAPDGTPYVAWEDYAVGDGEIFVRRWNGSSWEEVGTGSASGGGISNDSGYSYTPSLAIAPDSTPCVAWWNWDISGDKAIYVRCWNGSSWEEVGAGSASGGGISNSAGAKPWPSMAIAPDGTPYVSWYDASDGDDEIYVRRWNGSSWEEVGTGSASGGGISDNDGDSEKPSMATAPDGTPYVAWYDESGGDTEIYVRRWNGSSWEEVGTGSASGGGISNDDSRSENPSVAIAPDSKVYVAWDYPDIWARHWDGSGWQEVGAGSATGGGISDNLYASCCPSLAVAPDGTRYVAWQDASGGGAEIYVRRRPGSGLTYTISGHVRDRQGDPVPDVLVSARGGGSATTDSQGAFTITGVMTGTYTLTPLKGNWAFCSVNRTVSVPPDVENQDLTGCSKAFAPEVVDFLTDSRVQIAHVSNAASDASVVGDYFLDKQAADAVQGVLNLVLDTVSLAGVNWKLVGPGLKHITTPGYKAALDASWSGWVGQGAKAHWFKSLYDSIHNNQKLLFEETAQAGLKYYAKQAGVETTKDQAKKWLIQTLVPGTGTPIWDQMGLPAIQLGNDYKSELLREQEELLALWGCQGPIPGKEDAYREDMLARRVTHAQLVGQLQGHRDLLWNSYTAAVADEANWLKLWGPLLAKWVVIGGATLMWDGPGFHVASAGLAVFDMIYNRVQDISALDQDGKMLDQSLRLLQGRASTTYSQIALNTVGALNLIRAGGDPQIAQGDVGPAVKKSFGQYRAWPGLWWAEESSQIELPISNTTAFATTLLTSASYQKAGFWGGEQRLQVEGQALELAGSGSGTAIIKLKTRKYGLSPDEGDFVDLLVLGATETGLYVVADTGTWWYPQETARLTGAAAQVPAGYTLEEVQSAPTLPYPLASLVSTPHGSTDHQVTIAVVNPFTLTVSATVTQAIPAAFTVLDDGGGAPVGDALVWTDVLSPGEGLELHALLAWEDLPGETTVMPGPELAFEDPDTGEGDTYTVPDETVSAPWPLDVSVDLPLSWQSGVTSTMAITLTNISSSVTAQGVLTVSVSTPDGTVLWESISSVDVPPQEAQLLSLPAFINTEEEFAAAQGEIALDSIHKEAFLEIVSVVAYRVYLPLVWRGH